ncbi:TetR/AcrR family transcriptional regulator [Nonomuraea endophytica]|uniref:AcrR family transcriptional regulator n=1 Tax=Nonomuraea endophytica TaxID=714136 RepID=A0A7W8AC96_9ACTN|nr:TetR/AcrR family transcriptional regulator [Nonomuraea endophytica]MBB5082461.1 AcrR family transcriptional regulator [Nonomuraea endophytica]
MTIQDAGAARPAGRPRSEKAEKAILEATLDLIGEGMGISELSIEAIAARAGVGKTTIYRRWSNKEDLVVDALATLKAPVPPLAGESVRDDLVTLLDQMRDESGHVRTKCVMNIALSESDRYPHLFEKFRKIAIEPRRAAMRQVLERGMASGELRSTLEIELAMAILTGTMVWFTKWGDTSDRGPELAEGIVDQVLAGIAP